MNNRDIRRTVTLSQQLTMETDADSPDHFIIPTRKNVPTHNHNIPTRSATGHWDGASLRTASGRTLFDIIQQDDNWKPVKDRLRVQRAGAAFSDSPTSSDGPPSSFDHPMERAPSSMVNGAGGPRMPFGGAPSLRRTPTLARSMTRSVSVQPGSVLATGSAPNVGEVVITEITDVTDENADENEKVEEEAKEESGQGGVSLMSLLEQTDTQWGDDGPEADELNFDDDEGGYDDDADGEGMYHVCCVCMVRHKGAAFIPCGHTFCRLCSRELWVSRGNCPLCNGFIQEILDIF